MSTADMTDGQATQVLGGSALTAENRSVEIEGAKLVYRRFGAGESDAPPLLCLQHFRGNLRGRRLDGRRPRQRRGHDP